jgi:hypothetical protein
VERGERKIFKSPLSLGEGKKVCKKQAGERSKRKHQKEKPPMKSPNLPRIRTDVRPHVSLKRSNALTHLRINLLTLLLFNALTLFFFNAYGDVNYDTAWTVVYDGGKMKDSSVIWDDFYDVKALADGGVICAGGGAILPLLKDKYIYLR